MYTHALKETDKKKREKKDFFFYNKIQLWNRVTIWSNIIVKIS